MKTYTLAELEVVTGAKRRSLQLWADRGVIQAEAATDNAGSGVHRRFGFDEAIIACAVAPFAKRQSPIGRLFRIAYQFRSRILANDLFREQIGHALAGSRPVFLILQSYYRKSNNNSGYNETVFRIEPVIGRHGEPLTKDEIEEGQVDMFDTYLEVCIVSFSSHRPTEDEHRMLGSFSSRHLGEDSGFTEMVRLDLCLERLR